MNAKYVVLLREMTSKSRKIYEMVQFHIILHLDLKIMLYSLVPGSQNIFVYIYAK